MKLFKKLPKKDIVRIVWDEDNLVRAAELYLLTKRGITPADKLLIRQAIVDIKTVMTKQSVKERAMGVLSGILDKYIDKDDPRGYLDDDPRDPPK